MKNTSPKKQRIGAMEVFGVGGFSFYLGYALVTFYWLFTDFPPELAGFDRGVVQAFVFAGVPLGYLGVHLFRTQLLALPTFRNARFIALILALMLPSVMFSACLGVRAPWAVYAAAAFLSGLGGAYFTLRWLDGCGSARVHAYLRFTSAGLVGGAVLFFLVCLVSPTVQPLFAVVYLIASFLFMNFLDSRTSHDERYAIKTRKEYLPFNREIEPSIFMFGMVFGLAFALLFVQGATAVLFGMVGVLLGAVVVLVLDLIGVSLTITVTQRVLLVVMVAACLVVPFFEGTILLVTLCVIVAFWSFFNGVNYALLVRRSVVSKTPVFFSVASGVSVSTFGFLVGWLVSLVYAAIGFPQVFIAVVMLGLAFVLVVTIMVFFPNTEHHIEKTPEALATSAATLHVDHDELNEKALFKMRCEAVAKLYGLTPRESDVLAYLAKGRNANYVQKMLTVSPHTAKSHIYSIYRKLDIHSQQKLMDFIEDYPIEVTNAPNTLRR